VGKGKLIGQVERTSANAKAKGTKHRLDSIKLTDQSTEGKIKRNLT
jgi:hypothetical protein